MKIESLLQKKESKTLEFKRDMTSLEPILKTLVAFANTAGGTLIIGSSNEGTPIGLQDILKAEERLANVISDSISPPIFPEIEAATYKGCDLLVVQVNYWKAPFFLKKEGLKKGVYVRLGSTNRLAPPFLLAELKRRNSLGASFDQEAVDELDKDSIDLKKVRAWISRVPKKGVEEKLKSLGLVVPFSNRLVPTVGGLILFGKSSERNQWVSHARVSCGCFEDENKVVFLDRFEIEDLLQAPDETMRFIEKNIRLRGEINGLRRTDIPDYPLVAVREVLINALAHADYSITGSHIQVALYSNRLEVVSPGMFPLGYTLEDFMSGTSHTRNKVIVKVFREINFMEEWGSGYKRITEACLKGGYLVPMWEEGGLFVRVTFYPYDPKAVKAKKDEKEPAITKEELEILQLFDQKEVLAFREIHKEIAMSERALRYRLSDLKKKGLLASQGKGRGLKWQRSSQESA